jgi:hypothetical protein
MKWDEDELARMEGDLRRRLEALEWRDKHERPDVAMGVMVGFVVAIILVVIAAVIYIGMFSK